MKRRNTIKIDLFADIHHRETIDKLGDPLSEIGSCIDFVALASEVDRIAPRPESLQGGRPPFPTETMVRILVLKRLYNLSDEQMEYQLLDRLSYKRFCGLAQATNIPDRTMVWVFENRIGEAGAKAIFDGVTAQLLKKGFTARSGQSLTPRWCPRLGSTSPRMTRNSLKRTPCPPTGRRPSGVRRTWMRPGPRSMARATMATSSR